MLILFTALSALLHFILADMIVFPHSENYRTARSVEVSFYKIDNIQNSEKTKSAGAVDKERNNKKESIVKKITEKKVPKRKTTKLKNSKNPIKPDKDEIQNVSVTENNLTDNKNKTEFTASKSTLTELTQIGKESSLENETTTNHIGVSLSGQNFAEKTIITNMPGIGPGFHDNKNTSFNSSKVTKSSWDEDEKKKYLQYIRKKVTSRIKYPYIARRRGIEGKILISFIIKKDGRFENIKIKEKSPYSVLNDAVLKAVENVVVAEKPEEEIEVDIPISFTLK
ncbi:MAG: TonB family protein [Flexistipes sinusarabici]|uniref:TonB family protein n=1 Tax=Flexistipes sinusarabici TaxID=2352 RepID=A0A5D0MQX5_FLESI|nr:TonB family protein [Flexistipes sinusarabici]TYB33219.1 MAG: TonB family protein [Flexistipes sinusarabici]